MTFPAIKKHVTLPNLIVGIGLLFFILTFCRSIAAMAAHGFTWHFLVLPLFIYMIFDQREKLCISSALSEKITGSILLFISFFLLFAGKVSATLMLSEIALLPGIWGVVLYLGGIRTVRILFWPLIYLVFISSGIDSQFSKLSPFLRHASAFCSTMMVRPFGFTTMLSGTYLRLPNMVLNVADECSGVNHLMAFSAMIFPIGALLHLKKRNIFALLVLTIPLTILSNSIRVAILIAINYHRTVFTHGPKDILMTGTGFYIGLLFLALFTFWLSKIPGLGQKKGNHGLPTFASSPKWSSLLPLALVLAAGMFFTHFWRVHTDQFTPVARPFDSELNGWEITPIPEISQLNDFPTADVEFQYKISDYQGHAAMIYCGYYRKQGTNREIAGYHYDKTLKACTVSRIGTDTSSTIACRICRGNGDNPNSRFFVFYATRNRITAQPVLSKIYTIFDALLYRTTSASIIVFILPQEGISGSFPPSALIDAFYPNIAKWVLQ